MTRLWGPTPPSVHPPPSFPCCVPLFFPFPSSSTRLPPSFLLCHPGFHVLHFLSLFFSSCLHLPYFITSYFFHSLLFPPMSATFLTLFFASFILSLYPLQSPLLVSPTPLLYLFCYSTSCFPSFPSSFFLPSSLPFYFLLYLLSIFFPSSFVYSFL